MSHHYVRFENLSFSYPKGGLVLDGINCEITHGEKVALLGLNGSGKSTFLLQINGLLLPSSGQVVVGGTPVTRKTAPAIRERVGLIFQNPDDMLFMPTIGEDVAFGLRNMRLPEDVVSERVKAALADVGLSDLADRPPMTLSGGQRRAAAIATVLSMQPDILLLDEPSANLDAAAVRRLVDILSRFKHTVVLATHDIELGRILTPRAILLDKGKILFDGPFEEGAKLLADLALKANY